MPKKVSESLPGLAEELSHRHRDVLAAVVMSFVLDGAPVGSRTVARKFIPGLSPATIRNVMADLEEAGLLAQPHTSAGRVPTDLGYRYYVDRVMAHRSLSERERRLIRVSMPDAGEAPEVEDLLERTVKLLAAMSTHVGIILVPRFSNSILRRLEFLRLGPRRILAIFVSQSGMVDHKILEPEQDIEEEELQKINAVVREHFLGMTLPQLRARLLELMSEEKALYDQMLSRALRLAKTYLDQRESEGSDVLVEGTSNVVQPDVADVERMRHLFRAFEDKSRLVGLLNSCIEEDSPQVHIGSECVDPDLRDFTLITSPYRYRDQTVGALGILGPRRMQYDRQVTLVGSLSRFLSDALNRRARGRDDGPAPGGEDDHVGS